MSMLPRVATFEQILLNQGAFSMGQCLLITACWLSSGTMTAICKCYFSFILCHHLKLHDALFTLVGVSVKSSSWLDS